MPKHAIEDDQHLDEGRWGGEIRAVTFPPNRAGRHFSNVVCFVSPIYSTVTGYFFVANSVLKKKGKQYMH
jgi:hypothetical protein